MDEKDEEVIEEEEDEENDKGDGDDDDDDEYEEILELSFILQYRDMSLVILVRLKGFFEILISVPSTERDTSATRKLR